MALFESYERREKQILAVLKEYGINSIEEAGPAAMLSGCNVRPVPPPEATEKYFLPCSIHSFLYVPATGCWKRVGFVELPVIDTSTPSLCMIATPSVTSLAP